MQLEPDSLSSRREPRMVIETNYSGIEMRLLANLPIFGDTHSGKSLNLVQDLHFADFYGLVTGGPRLSPVEVEQAKYLDMSERLLELAEELLEHKFHRLGMKTPVFMLASVISV